MYPDLIPGSGVPAHTYGLFIALALSAAFLVVHLRAHKAGIHPDKLPALYLSAALGGVIGARFLYSVAVTPGALLENPLSIFGFSGFAFYGGVIGGAIGVAAYAIPKGINPWKLADLAGPAVLLGLGIGRMGCFSSGCCHGAPAPVSANPTPLLPLNDGLLFGQIWLSDVFPFLTLEFHAGVSRYLHEPLYPTQLWSVFAGTSLAMLLLWFWRHRRFDGQIAALWLMVEPPTRILIEAFRADHRGYAISLPVSESIAEMFPGMVAAGATVGDTPQMGLTTSQTIGIAMMIVGVVIYAVRFRIPRNDEEFTMADDGIADELL